MKTDINELITLNYELEGLLLLALHRGDDTPRRVWNMIYDHVRALADGVSKEIDEEAADESLDSTVVKNTVNEPEPVAIPDEDIAGVDEAEELTLDEKLARANSKCLRRAFSLNDRFRFRRELFGNSDVAMADALNLVEAMHTIDEAREYFFDELEWNPDDDEVKDFMDIITKHFLGR